MNVFVILVGESMSQMSPQINRTLIYPENLIRLLCIVIGVVYVCICFCKPRTEEGKEGREGEKFRSRGRTWSLNSRWLASSERERET